MNFIIRIYYDLQDQLPYNTFYNYIIEHYLNLGYTFTYNKNYYREHISKLINTEKQEIMISAKPLIETAVKGHTADIIYIQHSALQKVNRDIATYFNTLNPKEVDIYIFDKTGVIGVWNTN